MDRLKAAVLAERFDSLYHRPIWAISDYLHGPTAFDAWIPPDHAAFSYGVPFPLLIGCVDNHATRQILHQIFLRWPEGIYIDTVAQPHRMLTNVWAAMTVMSALTALLAEQQILWHVSNFNTYYSTHHIQVLTPSYWHALKPLILP
ncbi:hypothetical protein [Sulfobacillus thermosulfidooxidans]|uniref:hypothetical protein n=1 Tax=Sulfobacillus thermosulfidooxidans TaxID=28034 RepID=UPI0006B5ECEC|nr:hypothetical protein [Sulfobacillus thermosulfidooxidans]